MFLKLRHLHAVMLVISFVGLGIFLYRLQTIDTSQIETTKAASVRGLEGDLWADFEIGKRDFSEIAAREIVPYKLNIPGGIVVDTRTSPGKLYVWDAGNNRIVGAELATCYSGSGPCSATLVIGQPSLSDYGACNRDSGFQNYPNRTPASADTLCGIWEGTHTTLEDKSFASMFVGTNGALYVPDIRNNRVLKYNDPFATDTRADEVWGQDSFSGNECNKTGKMLTNEIPNPTNSSLCFSDDYANGGVAIDQAGNLWVSDTGNNRILRFPFISSTNTISKSSNLVLGQSGFASRTAGAGTNQMNHPSAVQFDAAGKMYVADTANNRVLVFTPPFTAGMSAVVFGSDFQEGILSLTYDNTTNTIITLENFDNGGRVRIWNLNGIQMYQFRVESLAGGSVGLDSQGNVLVSGYRSGHNVYRYAKSTIQRDRCSIHDGNVSACDADTGCGYYWCSDQCWLKGTPEDIACPAGDYLVTKRLFSPPPGYNITSNKRLEHSAWVGVAATASQVVVADGRLLFWNNPQNLTNGKAADGYLGASSFTEIPSPQFSQVKSDASGRIWAAKVNEVRMYQSPLTTGMNPAKTLTTIPVLGGGSITFSDVWGIAVAPDSTFLWISESNKNRVMRVRNPLTNPVIDVILGQKSITGAQCNRGLIPAPNTNPSRPASEDADRSMLCYPGAVSFDRLGNVYVSDHFIEAEGNWRLLMFSKSTFPDTPTSVVYAPFATKEFPRATASNQYPHMTFEPAFDSKNRMVIGQNPYSGKRFVEFYNDPARVNSTNPSDPEYAKPDGTLPDYYGWPVAATFDTSDNLYVYDANRGQVRMYKKPFGTTTTATPRPTNTITPQPAIPGDANGDSHVDGIDFVIWLSHYNKPTSNKALDGDFNSDGFVDGIDFTIWLANYGK